MCLRIRVKKQIYTNPTHAQSISRETSPLIHYGPIILLADSEGPDPTARMRGKTWAFTVHIWPKTSFRMVQPIL